MEKVSFTEWAKKRLKEIAAEKDEKKEKPKGDPRTEGYLLSYSLCKYHGIDVTAVSKAVREGDIEGYVSGSHLWVKRDEFRDFFNIG